MPITVVSNSSPIIHLAKIDQLNLLSDFFGELIIPPAVYAECITEGKGRPEVARIKQASWLRVVPVANQNLITLLNAEIDRGEAEAIALALETQAALLLLDDADAREKARLYHLKMTGLLGILLRARARPMMLLAEPDRRTSGLRRRPGKGGMSCAVAIIITGLASGAGTVAYATRELLS